MLVVDPRKNDGGCDRNGTTLELEHHDRGRVCRAVRAAEDQVWSQLKVHLELIVATAFSTHDELTARELARRVHARDCRDGVGMRQWNAGETGREIDRGIGSDDLMQRDLVDRHVERVVGQACAAGVEEDKVGCNARSAGKNSHSQRARIHGKVARNRERAAVR